jgi:hypothetical protein
MGEGEINSICSLFSSPDSSGNEFDGRLAMENSLSPLKLTSIILRRLVPTFLIITSSKAGEE